MKAMYTQEELEKAKSMSGWTKKKSPNFLSQWQKRFIMIVDKATKLAYFDGDNLQKNKPKGFLEIQKILGITAQGQRQLIISYEGRNFQFKFKKASQRDEWRKSLWILKKNLSPPQRHKSGSYKNAQQREKKQSSIFDQLGAKSWKEGLDQLTVLNIQQQKNRHLQKNGLSQQIIQQQAITNSITQDQIIDNLKLNDYLKRFKPDVIKHRFLYGFVDRRNSGKMKYYKPKFFFLISAKTLKPHLYKDDILLHQTDLPPWMQLDTLYSCRLQKKQAKQIAKMNKCVQVSMKDMTQSKTQKGYTIRINFGDRIIQVMVKSQVEREHWTECLKQSAKTAKQIYNKSNIVLSKNIDIIIDIYDSSKSLIEKRSKIRQKFKQDLIQIADIFNNQIKTVPQFIEIMQLVLSDSLQLINSCLAKQMKRTDIIKQYVNYIHEVMTKLLTDLWDKNYMTIPTGDLPELAIVLQKYENTFKIYLSDSRMQASIKVLIKMFFTKSQQKIQTFLKNIIEIIKTQQPFQEQEILKTNSPSQTFHIINGLVDKINIQSKDATIQLATYSKKLIKYYQSMLLQLLDEISLSNQQLIAICNNNYEYIQKSNQVFKNIMSKSNCTEQEVNQCFDLPGIKKGFVQIGNRGKYYIELAFFGNLKQKFKGVSFLQLNMQLIIQSIFNRMQGVLGKLKTNFLNAIYKNILEQIVIHYFNCLLTTLSKKSKSKQVAFHYQNPLIITKIRQDIQILFNKYQLSDKTMEACLQPLENLLLFINESSLITIPKHCQQLRKHFGHAFNLKAAVIFFHQKHLLSLNQFRNSTKEQLQNVCLTFFQRFTKQNPYQKINSKLFLIDQSDSQLQSGKSKSISENKRRQSIHLDFEEQQTGIQMSEMAKNQQQTYINEGFLDKKKGNKTFSQKRFFRIRDDYLYWYMNKTSREFQNKINLANVQQIHYKDKQNFKIILEDGKKMYQLKAENKVIAETWVKSLRREIDLINKKQEIQFDQIVQEGKESYIKDYFQIQRKQKARIKKLEKKKKLQQKIKMQKKQKQQRESVILLKLEQRENSIPIRQSMPTPIYQSKRLSLSKPLMKQNEQSSKGICHSFWACLGLQQ